MTKLLSPWDCSRETTRYIFPFWVPVMWAIAHHVLTFWVLYFWLVASTFVFLDTLYVLRMYCRWSLCTLYLLACQVRGTIGKLGLWCCIFYIFWVPIASPWVLISQVLFCFCPLWLWVAFKNICFRHSTQTPCSLCSTAVESGKLCDTYSVYPIVWCLRSDSFNKRGRPVYPLPSPKNNETETPMS